MDETDEFYSKLFSYLDTCSNQQFSLFDYSDVEGVDLAAIPNSRIFLKIEQKNTYIAQKFVL